MLPKPFRLKSRTLFNKAMSAGQAIGHSPYCVILALPRPYPSEMATRVGFVVSKKVSNRANKRNKIRRRLQEIMRTEILPRFGEKILPYSAVIIIARNQALDAPYQTLKETLVRLFERHRPRQ